MDYYTEIFAERQRNPTNVELFDLAQSNRSVGIGTGFLS